MSEDPKAQFAEHQANFWKLIEPTRAFLLDIERRLLVGQERYGGWKFEEHDLDQMSLEEIDDFVVYIVAKSYLKRKSNDPRIQSPGGRTP